MKTFALAAAAALLATPVFAHAHLLQSDPADKAVLAAAPKALVLHFSQAVQPAFTGIAVAGPDKHVVPLGAAGLDRTGEVMTVPVAAPLPPGAYVVSWHALAADGHKTEGSYGFIVK